MEQTRYQILFTDSNKVENFTAKQKKVFDARVKELSKRSEKFTTWDTRRNALSSMFKF